MKILNCIKRNPEVFEYIEYSGDFAEAKEFYRYCGTILKDYQIHYIELAKRGDILICFSRDYSTIGVLTKEEFEERYIQFV